MGVVVAQVVFDGQAPKLSRIAEKVTELSGLAMSVTESGADLKADVYDLHAYLAFDCDPKDQLELYSYRVGTAPGTQTVYLSCNLNQELTLLVVTVLALEALHGRPRDPITEIDRREFGTRITATQLVARRRIVEKQAMGAALVAVLLLPVIVLLWLGWFVLTLLIMPESGKAINCTGPLWKRAEGKVVMAVSIPVLLPKSESQASE
ncbi:MAG: hypothetical protein ACJ8FY_01720 [Gemmataceae bacterium]